MKNNFSKFQDYHLEVDYLTFNQSKSFQTNKEMRKYVSSIGDYLYQINPENPLKIGQSKHIRFYEGF